MAVMGFALAACSTEKIETDYTSFVDTKIGSGGHGHVFVGANVPFGFVQLGATSIPVSWDWCSGYHDSDSTVIGFSHSHLNGTGIGDLFDVTVMPVTGKVTFARGEENSQESGLWSYADRSKEVSVPGYYSVPLTRYDIKAELTASARVGFHKYTFPENDEAAIVFDLENGGCWDKRTESNIEVVNSNAIQGYRYSKGWANNQKIFFYAEFSKPFSTNEELNTESGISFGKFDFQTAENEEIMLKVAISPVSMENAKLNMETEIPGWDFETVKANAKAAWNKELSKIQVKTEDNDVKTTFYTAMYHSMIQPCIYNDVNNDYRGANDEVYNTEGFTNYTVFSLWDTYRAANPLMTVIHPEKVNDVVNAMLKIYEQQGKLPVWHLMSCETNCMVGNPGVIVVGDAIVKGFDGFDKEKAYEAMKASVMLPERGMDLRIKYGFIPSDLYNESIANDMEYAIADAAVAHAAKYLGKEEDYKFFTERSHSYRNYFDKETEFARGKFVNGKFRTPFDPRYAKHRENDYCEGNAFQYTWLAPHDIKGLETLFGSKEHMIEKLDGLFTASSDLGDEASPDISGMIGQYVHGNEPSHHIIYLYTMAGEPAKAASRVREVLNTMYSTEKNGLAGNEDVGQMSSWYILSSMGIYQTEPASQKFWFGSPIFDEAKIKVTNGEFVIKALNNSDENIYIQNVTLNGKEYNKGYINYKDIEKGGELVFTMGSKPTCWY